MTQEIRHKTKYSDSSSAETLLAGEIVYTDSNTIKIGDGTHVFSQLPEFSSNDSVGDNSTIKANSAKKLQAHGTLNQNPSATGNLTKVFDWIGTNQEYTTQNIATTHPDWLCFITDDAVGNVSGTYTKAEIDAFLDDKADGSGTAVLTSGDQNIEGNKTFLNNNLKSKSGTIDYTVTPSGTEYLSLVMAHDKNGQRIGNVELYHNTDGSIALGLNASVKVGSNNVYSPVIRTCISQDGTTKWVEAGQNPTSTYANNTEIATTAHIINVLKAIYPVGSLYIGTQATCPMGSFFGTWTLVSSGKALWTGTGSNGNSTIAAGLPNITGTFRGGNAGSPAASGAFVVDSSVGGNGWDGTANMRTTWSFDASRSSSVYGNSSTVQPPAYVVNVWRRVS